MVKAAPETESGGIVTRKVSSGYRKTCCAVFLSISQCKGTTVARYIANKAISVHVDLFTADTPYNLRRYSSHLRTGDGVFRKLH